MNFRKNILVYLVASFVVAYDQAAPTSAAHEVSIEAMENKQLTKAEVRWPGTTREQLDSGETIFTTKCLKCHGNYALTAFTEDRWKYELRRMSGVAKLSAQEEVQLTRYVLSLRDVEISVRHYGR